jgi:glucose-1-phosphate cytidylyltransferase
MNKTINKAVILAGGFGTRIAEESHLKPKPMIEIGSKPMLWHIMKIYAHYGINEFIICLGYKGYIIKEYFKNYFLHNSDVTFDLSNNQRTVHCPHSEPWQVTLVDTGENTLTGGRLKRVREYLQGEDFCFTYGDGVGDIDIQAQIQFHQQHQKLATITAVKPQGRFGILDIDNHHQVTSFHEKWQSDAGWINGGFFVLSDKVIDYIEDDKTAWELAPMRQLVAENNMLAYQHRGFWCPMDTLRDKRYLEELWMADEAPWKIWD